jgi:hypothetical protein
MMRTMNQVNKVIPRTNLPLVRLMSSISRLLLERMKIVLASMHLKFKDQIECFPASLYESCDSYDQAHKYLEEYLHEEKGNEKM